MKEKIALAAGFCEDWEICPQCKPRMTAILALIEAREKPMVEALKEAQTQLQYCNERNPLGTTVTVIARIDAVLPKGEGK